MVCEALDVKSLWDRRNLVGRESQIPSKVRPSIFFEINTNEDKVKGC